MKFGKPVSRPALCPLSRHSTLELEKLWSLEISGLIDNSWSAQHNPLSAESDRV